MSVLGRRLAAAEGAFFLQESKNAAGRLAAQKKKKPGEGPIQPPSEAATDGLSDVLPEVLRHSLPIIADCHAAASSLADAGRWALRRGAAASPPPRAGAANPLLDYVSLPRVTLGPKRWQLPEGQSSALASTANELRRERCPPHVDAEKLKAAAAGMSQIGKAFAIATALVFGGATSAFVLTASKLQLRTTEDFKNKGRDLIQPTAEIFQSRMAPFREWAETRPKKWRRRGKDKAEEKSQTFKRDR
ncbi:coiled-coil protein [Wolffia australiana]